MGKAIAVFFVLFVIGVVLAGVIDRGFQAAPAPTPQPNIGSSVSTAVANSTIEISGEVAENIAIEAINTDGQTKALEIQAGLAEEMSTDMKEVAQTGYAANVAISANGTFGMVAIVFLFVVGLVGGACVVIWLLDKLGKQEQKSGGE